MSGGAIEKKVQRLYLIISILMAHPAGLTTAELAERCGVTRRTIQRDLLDLQGEPIRAPLIDDGRHWKVLPAAGYLLPPVQFDLGEATALFLAARLLCRYADETTPCLSAGLQKLAAILPPASGDHIRRTVEMMRCRPVNRAFEEVFTTLAMGWALHRKVRIWHQAAGSQHLRTYVLCPYFIEPSAIGYATYVIGHATYFEKIHTFKIERISRAELLEESFDLPADFDGPALLQSAWGIMYGEKLQLVVLRFTANVARRVREAVWHSSQVVEDEPDGGCRLTVQVAEPVEMKPWIRGWGADCEVLAPARLRSEIAQELRLAAGRYGDETEHISHQ